MLPERRSTPPTSGCRPATNVPSRVLTQKQMRMKPRSEALRCIILYGYAGLGYGYFGVKPLNYCANLSIQRVSDKAFVSGMLCFTHYIPAFVQPAFGETCQSFRRFSCPSQPFSHLPTVVFFVVSPSAPTAPASARSFSIRP